MSAFRDAIVEGFGCRPMTTRGLHRGRRPKAFNGRNRGK
jgi:hypothetical protein